MGRNVRVTKIQRMCFHDGDGLRTTVFLKGCSLHCPWCSNPENIRFEKETYSHDGKYGVYGVDYTSAELAKILCKDKRFWGSNGGVTFSGGEALLQSETLLEVMNILKQEDVNITVETSLFVKPAVVESVADYIDSFIVDVKIMDKALCDSVLGGDIEQYMSNVQFVHRIGKLHSFRLPLCEEYTFLEENREKQIAFLKGYKDVPVQIFSIHGLGKEKYSSLNRKYEDCGEVEQEKLDAYKKELMGLGIKSEVIRI